MTLGLIIPTSREVVPPGFSRQVRAEIAKISDIDLIAEHRRRLMALRAYVTKKEHRKELEAAERWCELRIGELLGKGKRGQPGQRQKSNAIAIALEPPRGDRGQFRLLAENKQPTQSSR